LEYCPYHCRSADVGFTNIGIPMISGKMVGTKPEHIVTQAEVDEIQTLLMETINQTETDLRK
jgi:hypothetical protein